ncbi:hypothetical protein J6590_010844 [Homalodisca vitripennis]|nr:hypothetical protein J6590_010844 [Homalodisca vitripennis]
MKRVVTNLLDPDTVPVTLPRRSHSRGRGPVLYRGSLSALPAVHARFFLPPVCLSVCYVGRNSIRGFYQNSDQQQVGSHRG